MLEITWHNGSKKTHFLFSTDSYCKDSIKSQERLRRGSSTKLIVDGPTIIRPENFKMFLTNSENKIQFANVMLKVWSSSDAYTRLQKCETAMLVVSGIVYQFRAVSGQIEVSEVAEICSNQEETDTRVIVYMKYASSVGFKTIVVRSPDTDILVLLLHHSPLAS